MSIGTRIRDLRGRETLQEFCDKISNIIKPANLSSIERDNSKPSVDVLMKICEVYDTSLDWLMRGIKPSDFVETTVRETQDDYKDKYIELLERHNKLLETKIDEKDQKIREQQLHN